MSRNEYTIAVLGAGPGGYVAAIRAAQLGASVALVEEGELGGVCLNRGCIPTKAMLESVHVLDLARRAHEYGVKVPEAAPDLGAIMDRKDRVCDALRRGVASLMKKNKVDVLRGRGVLKDRHTLRVSDPDGEIEVRAEKIILATGSAPQALPDFPFDGERIVGSDDALSFDHVPESLLIVGGGFIGCEWAGIYGPLGARIIVVEMMDRLLPAMDADLGRKLYKAFRKAKVEVHLGTRAESLEVVEDGVKVALSDGEERTVEKVMVCVGRRPRVENLGLAEVGVEVERGGVRVDEHGLTSVPNIYAVGDVTGGPLLAHFASAQGVVAAEHAMGRESALDARVVPAAVFTRPEIGTVGLTEAEANERGINAKSATFPMRGLGRAHALGETDGFFKIVADADTGEVLGCHILGPHASDLIAEAALALRLECTVEELVRTIHAHPTLPEGLKEAGEVWLDRPIHT